MSSSSLCLSFNDATILTYRFGDGVAYQWSYYASIFSSAAKLGNIRFGGYIVPRAASGWPPGSGGERHMKDGLFRKIMTYVGGGAKAIKYFCFGPEYEFPVRPET